MASPYLSRWHSVRTLDSVGEYFPQAGNIGSSSIIQPRAVTVLWMAVDVLTILTAAAIAIYLRKASMLSVFDHRAPLASNPSSFLLYLAGFSLILLFINHAHGLYGPLQSFGGLHEQRLTVQACSTSSLILAGVLYFGRADSISRAVVIATLLITTFLLCFRRAAWRLSLYRRYEKGLNSRNVLVIGTGPSGLAIRSHLQRIQHLGFTFKGFVKGWSDFADEEATESLGLLPEGPEILGDLSELGNLVRRYFIDELFITGPCEREAVQQLIAQARSWSVNLRVVPDLYDGLAWNAPIEYVGQFPTMPVHHRPIPAIALPLKRMLDLVVSICVLILFSPLFALIALAIRLDSKGPIFYCAERIGRKGNTFRCWKFRTMVVDADLLQEQYSQKNVSDGVPFKMQRDPRVTRLGALLRKYSLDELPQFYNVLKGDMSVVGPRPPLAGEVRQYALPHLRRLEVLPGITGLCQVQARQDPSFDHYISLDTAYIDNWSFWLDIKIMMRTIGVVLNGTGA